MFEEEPTIPKFDPSQYHRTSIPSYPRGEDPYLNLTRAHLVSDPWEWGLVGSSDNPGLEPNLSLLSAVPSVPSPRARVTTLSNPLAASASRWTASRGTVLGLSP